MKSSIALKSFVWQYLERFSVQGISFVVTIVLARLLSPEEYGIVSIAMILISLLEVFVTSGLGNALVQKKSVTTLDYSTVFYFNVALAVLIYIVIYIVAEPISSIYNSESLSNILRIMSLRVIIASLNTIQYAYIQRNMIFKQLFFSSVVTFKISEYVSNKF